MKKSLSLLILFLIPYAYAQDIKLNGTISAENNQIKNVSDPTDDQDAATKNYTYSKAEVDELIDDIRVEFGNQIDNDDDGYTENQGDCDDSDANTYPGATEIEDGSDNDCDGEIDQQQLQVGDFYGGGVVFYIFVDGDEGYVAGEHHGLIVAVSDQSTGERWHKGSNSNTGATATAVGTGITNTTTIIDNQGGITETSFAAGLAGAYTGGGYTDWFLPSKDELNIIYLNKHTINATAVSNSGSDFAYDYYWSSSEKDYNFATAWCQTFYGGYQEVKDKSDNLYVRAVRAF